MDWHEIAVGSAGIIGLLVAWIWISMNKWLTGIAERFDEHIADDSRKFAEVLGKMNDYHISILNKLNE